jgi:MFS family permease
MSAGTWEMNAVEADEGPSLIRQTNLPASERTDKDVEVPEDATEAEDIPPNGGYGWVCVVAACALNASAWGLNSAFGVYLAYYLAYDTFPGTTPFAFAFIGSLSISQALITSPVITITTRTWGVRVTLLIGVFLLTSGLLGASFANAFWQLLLAQGVCYGWGMGFLYVGSLGILPQWFSTHRSLAQGIAASGAGVGGVIYNLAANALNESVGWRWSLRVLVASGFAITLVCALVLRDRNKQIKPSLATFEWKLLARYEILLIVMWGSLSELGYIVLYYSMPSYAASIGLSARQGSVAGTMLNVGLAVGRPVMGQYSDTFGRINMAGAGTAICALLCLFVWIFAKSYGVLLFFAVMAGMVCGTFWATIAPVGAEVVGLKELSSALSMTWLLLVAPCTFAEPIAVVMVSGSGDSAWLRPQLFVGFMYMGAALCTLALRAWKIVGLKEKRDREGTDGHDGNTLVSVRNNAVGVVVHHLLAAFQWKRV